MQPSKFLFAIDPLAWIKNKNSAINVAVTPPAAVSTVNYDNNALKAQLEAAGQTIIQQNAQITQLQSILAQQTSALEATQRAQTSSINQASGNATITELATTKAELATASQMLLSAQNSLTATTAEAENLKSQLVIARQAQISAESLAKSVQQPIPSNTSNEAAELRSQLLTVGQAQINLEKQLASRNQEITRLKTSLNNALVANQRLIPPPALTTNVGVPAVAIPAAIGVPPSITTGKKLRVKAPLQAAQVIMPPAVATNISVPVPGNIGVPAAQQQSTSYARKQLRARAPKLHVEAPEEVEIDIELNERLKRLGFDD